MMGNTMIKPKGIWYKGIRYVGTDRIPYTLSLIKQTDFNILIQEF